MKILITGASGYIGRFVAQALAKDNQVIGMSRKATVVTESLSDICWRFGDLKDENYLKPLLVEVDVIVHCAMGYDQDGNEDQELDTQSLNLILASGKRVIYTSNLFGIKDGRFISEEPMSKELYWRFGQEKRVLIAGGAIVRLGFVYGEGNGYFWETLKPDEQNNIYLSGSEKNHWPMVHVVDLACLFALVIEKKANGIFHGWDGYITRGHKLMKAIAKLVDAEVCYEVKGYAAKFMTNTLQVGNDRGQALGWKVKKGNLMDTLPEIISEYGIKKVMKSKLVYNKPIKQD